MHAPFDPTPNTPLSVSTLVNNLYTNYVFPNKYSYNCFVCNTCVIESVEIENQYFHNFKKEMIFVLYDSKQSPIIEKY